MAGGSKPRLVLASGSPRRLGLLRDAGYEFDVVLPQIEEIAGQWLTIGETTAYNAMRKALAISRIRRDAIVLAADTLVILGGHVIGKPADMVDAVEILGRLSGRSHEVWTSVVVCQRASGKAESFQEVSRVFFRKLDDRAIANYLARIDPLDKAGAYAAQGYGTEIIERIEGSYTNVVGLPMEKTARVLREFGITNRPRINTDETRIP